MPVKYNRESPQRTTLSGRSTPFIRLSEMQRGGIRKHFIRIYLGLFLVVVVIYAGHYFLDRNRYKDQPLEYGEGVVIRIEELRGNSLSLELALVDAQGTTLVAQAEVKGPEWKDLKIGAPVRLAFHRSRDGKAIRVETCMPRSNNPAGTTHPASDSGPTA